MNFKEFKKEKADSVLYKEYIISECKRLDIKLEDEDNWEFRLFSALVTVGVVAIGIFWIISTVFSIFDYV